MTDVLADVMPVVRVDMLCDVMLDVAADMLPGIVIAAMATPEITMEFVGEIAYAGDMLADVLAVLIADGVPAIDVDMLADENADVSAAVALSTP